MATTKKTQERYEEGIPGFPGKVLVIEDEDGNLTYEDTQSGTRYYVTEEDGDTVYTSAETGEKFVVGADEEGEEEEEDDEIPADDGFSMTIPSGNDLSDIISTSKAENLELRMIVSVSEVYFLLFRQASSDSTKKKMSDNVFYQKILLNYNNINFSYSPSDPNHVVCLEIGHDLFCKKIGSSTKGSSIRIEKKSGTDNMIIELLASNGTSLTSGMISVKILRREPAIGNSHFDINKDNSNTFVFENGNFSLACNSIMRQKPSEVSVHFFSNGYTFFVCRNQDGSVSQASPILRTSSMEDKAAASQLMDYIRSPDSHNNTGHTVQIKVIGLGVFKNFAKLAKITKCPVSFYIRQGSFQYYSNVSQFTITSYVGK